jgi:Tol biopolymer transport system component
MKRLLVPVLLVALAACGDSNDLPRATARSPENANHRVSGYSPDGSRIYFWQQDGGVWRFYVSPADMRAPEPIPLETAAPGFESDDTPILWSADGSRFVVAVPVNTVYPQVWLVNAAAGEPKRLTPEGDFAVPTSWHPDGRRLMYATIVEGSVYAMVVDVDSGGPRRLMPGETRPHWAAWSPDGSRVVVGMFSGGQETIWFADSMGANLRQATSEGFESPSGWGTAWSPDGSAILYTSRRTGTSDIWVLPVDGSAPRQLTSDVRDDDEASWSPDGRWVAFHSNRGLQDDIWVVPAEGGEASRVTDDASREEIPSWRPGTSEIAYRVNRQSRSLWSHSLADGTERQLTDDSLDVGYFTVSSTGSTMAVLVRGGGVSDFAAVPLAGGEPRILLRDARSSYAHWSPDGSQLAFSSTRAGANANVWVMDSSGSGLRQVTTWPEGVSDFHFTADGSALDVVSRHEARWGDVWRVPLGGGEPTRVTTTDKVLGICGNTREGVTELVVPTLADAPVTVALMRVRPDGTLQPVWDRTTLAGCPEGPKSDSVTVNVAVPGGGLQAMRLPLRGGAGRRLLEVNQGIGLLSPDTRQAIMTYSAQPPFDLGILTFADGSVRRVTTTPASEQGAEWSPDGSSILFRRVTPVRRITTADVGRLLARQE